MAATNCAWQHSCWCPKRSLIDEEAGEVAKSACYKELVWRFENGLDEM